MTAGEGKYYIYRHIRLDKNEPFYIGMGTKPYTTPNSGWSSVYKRAKEFKGRGSIWNNIVSKTDYRIDIVLESDNFEFIKNKEIELIALYGRRDLKKGILSNLTDGGGGSLGKIPKNRIKVYQFTKDGKFVKEWESQAAVAKYLNTSSGCINDCLKHNKLGYNRSIRGFVWRLNNEFGTPPPRIKKDSYPNKKLYLYIDGIFIKEFTSISSCKEELNLAHATILKNIKGQVINGKVIKPNYKFYLQYKGEKYVSS